MIDVIYKRSFFTEFLKTVADLKKNEEAERRRQKATKRQLKKLGTRIEDVDLTELRPKKRKTSKDTIRTQKLLPVCNWMRRDQHGGKTQSLGGNLLSLD